MSNPRSASMEATRFWMKLGGGTSLAIRTSDHKLPAPTERASTDRDIIHNSKSKGKQKRRAAGRWIPVKRTGPTPSRRLEMQGVPQVLDFPVIVECRGPSPIEAQPLEKLNFLRRGIAA